MTDERKRAESAQSALDDAHVELDRIRSEHAAAVQRADEAEARAARQRASPTEPGPLLPSNIGPPGGAAAGPIAASNRFEGCGSATK